MLHELQQKDQLFNLLRLPAKICMHCHQLLLPLLSLNLRELLPPL
jgi:hypothetical protein